MKNKKTNNLKFLGVVFLSMLVLFVTIASAETGEAGGTTATDSVSSAGAQAIATGSETIATVEAIVSSDGASSSATARAKAENGGTASAIAEAWANWVDGSSAYARAIATAVAGAGDTIWAEATAQASASSGRTSAYAGACVGGSGCIDRNEGNNGGGDNGGNNNGGADNGGADNGGADNGGADNGGADNGGADNGGTDNGGNNNGHVVPPSPKPKLDSMGGFIFGKGAIDRYCTFKLQLLDGNTSNDYRAKYMMYDVIAWGEYGFTGQQFEEKYNITDGSCTQILNVSIKTNNGAENGNENIPKS